MLWHKEAAPGLAGMGHSSRSLSGFTMQTPRGPVPKGAPKSKIFTAICSKNPQVRQAPRYTRFCSPYKGLHSKTRAAKMWVE